MLESVLAVATVKPAVDLADVFADYFSDYLQVAYCTAEQFAAVNAILKCRTAALGGHLRVCDTCGRAQLVFNACHNRHCPQCGAWERAQWLARQGARLLPVPHFHVVFTLDTCTDRRCGVTGSIRWRRSTRKPSTTCCSPRPTRRSRPLRNSIWAARWG